ncbi:MAG: Gfo/Idh/MocA family protein [Alphaproteobacteria bacterium]
MAAQPEFRLGVIGAGRWGRNLLATIPTLSGVQLAAVASANPDTAKLVPPGCAVVQDWHRLLREIPLDGLCLAVPAVQQADIALTAFAAGLPVMAEKPLALTLGATERVVAAARTASLPLLVDFIHLFNPAYRAMRAALLGSGPIRRIDSVGGNRGPFRPACPPLWDYGPHDLSLCLDLAQSPVTGLRARRIDRAALPEGAGEIVELDLGFQSGVRASIRCGNLMHPKTRKLTVETETDVFVFDDLSATPLTRDYRGHAPEALPVSGPPPLAAALAAFVDMARSRQPDWRTAELALDVARCLTAADRELDQ